jgi:DNA-binding MarR family transcriptional regulator
MQTVEDLIKSPPIKDPHRRTALNIMYTASWLLGKISKVVKPFGLTEPQHNVLRILERQGGTPMNLYEIQDRMIQKNSNVSRIIDKLMEKDLVTRRESDGNRRRVDIFITDKGLELTNTCADAVHIMLRAEVFGNMKREKMDMLCELMDMLRTEKV